MRNQSNDGDINRPESIDSTEMSFDVTEWFESERREHERRMQKLGCLCMTTEKIAEPTLKKTEIVGSKQRLSNQHAYCGSSPNKVKTSAFTTITIEGVKVEARTISRRQLISL